MDRNKALVLYILGTLGQIWAVCITVFILRRSGMIVDYTSSIGMVAIAIGGASSAIWGIIIAVKYRKCELKKILKDFLNVKQEYRSYLLVILFLCLDFFAIAFNEKLLINSWYIPLVLFFKAILFGGIEEIGWRYIFQPILQERYNYVLSTIITFVLWGLWHFSYFYIEGTLPQVKGVSFLIGLLVNCFILSALYIKTNSFWICVMTHALINVFSQLAVGGNQYVSYVCKIIVIVVAIVLSTQKQNKSETNVSVL